LCWHIISLLRSCNYLTRRARIADENVIVPADVVGDFTTRYTGVDVVTEILTLGVTSANAGLAEAVVYAPSNITCCWSAVRVPDVVPTDAAIVLLAVTVVELKLNVAFPNNSQFPAVNVTIAPFVVVLLAIDADVVLPLNSSPTTPAAADDPSVTPWITLDVRLPVAVPANAGDVMVAPDVIVAGIEMFAPPLNDVAVPVTAPEIANVLAVWSCVAVSELPVTFPVTFPVMPLVVRVAEVVPLTLI